MKTDTKKIEWAYPSSPYASRFGFGRTGCYVLEIVSGKTGLSRAVSGHATIQSAEATAGWYNQPWNSQTRREHTEPQKLSA